MCSILESYIVQHKSVCFLDLFGKVEGNLNPTKKDLPKDRKSNFKSFVNNLNSHLRLRCDVVKI